MLDKHIKAVSKFNAFTKGAELGLSPESAKAEIVRLLSPYVKDHALLSEFAVYHFASEAINVGYICSRHDWKTLFEQVIATRESATAKNQALAVNSFNFFEQSIRSAQKEYSMLVAFEQQKDNLGIREFCYEAFRTIGPLIESTIQPFLKEFVCFAQIANGKTPDTAMMASSDLGTICQRVEQEFPNPELILPSPWNIRLNQWRNIAQHLSYEVENDKIKVSYGKSQSSKTVYLTREDVLNAMREIVRRLSILKGARELYSLNYFSVLNIGSHELEEDVYHIATEISASFGTQGFDLIELTSTEATVTVRFLDVSPKLNDVRHWHCSQFLIPISQRFPGKNVAVIYTRTDASNQFTFSASAEDLAAALAADNPLLALKDQIEVKKQT